MAFLAVSAKRVEREAREAEAGRQRELDNANALAATEMRRARITRRFLYVAGTLALLAAAAAIYAFNRGSEASRQAVRAENNLATATIALIAADQSRGTAEAEAIRAIRAEDEAGLNLATAEAALATTEAEKARADRSAAEAQSRQLVAQAHVLPSFQAIRASLLSIHAAHLSDKAEAFSAVNLYTGRLARQTYELAHIA